MLQAIHTKERVRQASSLYCQWICVERPEGTRLIAIWMDSEMRAFAGEPEYPQKTELSLDDVAEEAGGMRGKTPQRGGQTEWDMRIYAA